MLLVYVGVQCSVFMLVSQFGKSNIVKNVGSFFGGWGSGNK